MHNMKNIQSTVFLMIKLFIEINNPGRHFSHYNISFSERISENGWNFILSASSMTTPFPLVANAIFKRSPSLGLNNTLFHELPFCSMPAIFVNISAFPLTPPVT